MEKQTFFVQLFSQIEQCRQKWSEKYFPKMFSRIFLRNLGTLQKKFSKTSGLFFEQMKKHAKAIIYYKVFDLGFFGYQLPI